MEDEIFYNQSKYIKELLKKFGLEDSKPTKTPMSTEIKLTKNDEADLVDSSKYQENPKTTHLKDVKRIFRYVRGTTHLGVWYPKGTRVETIVYADSDHAGKYVDRKSTSGVCMLMGCCLTSWDIYRTLENMYVHEERTIDPSFYNNLSEDLVAKFTAIGFDCLLSLYEQICSVFIFKFYKTLHLDRDQKNHLLIQFTINNHRFNISLAQYVELTSLPNQGICIYSDSWGLDELEKILEQIKPYNSRLLAIDDIRNLMHRRTIHEKVDK
uniref:Copia protein n=1 Tax=Tanacetum cinerariifolium TaxID=118510 RepID=A0A699I9I2_TANCI|nr:hypothetical protein [Tanacetum cinerariifolium]